MAGPVGARIVHIPVQGTVQLVELYEPVEAPDTSFGHIAGVIDIETVDSRIKPRIGLSGKSVKIMDSQFFHGLLKQGVIIEGKKMGAAKIGIAGAQFGEKGDVAGRPFRPRTG